MKINKYIDHTVLKPVATEADVLKLCAEAAQYGFASVCVNPAFVKLAKKALEGTDVMVCTVIGFPLGANTTETKVFEAKMALSEGCDEFDAVINVGQLKGGNTKYIANETRAIKDAIGSKTLKIIIETGLLTEEEKVAACLASVEGGADFVKTCTGFAAGQATPEDIALMKKTVAGKAKVKASGGIKTREAALALIEAGADRLGTSSGTAII